MLTYDEFMAAPLPFFWATLPATSRPRTHDDLAHIRDWIESHCGKGYTYFDPIKQAYVFQSEGDLFMFALWVSDDPRAPVEVAA